MVKQPTTAEEFFELPEDNDRSTDIAYYAYEDTIIRIADYEGNGWRLHCKKGEQYVRRKVVP